MFRHFFLSTVFYAMITVRGETICFEVNMHRVGSLIKQNDEEYKTSLRTLFFFLPMGRPAKCYEEKDHFKDNRAKVANKIWGRRL